MRSDDLLALPKDLPVPTDDGAAAHLALAAMPPIALRSTRGRAVRLDEDGDGGGTRFTVVYAYPRTGVPDRDAPPGFDAIPGARGCTPQSCAYRDHHAELRALGARVFGLSTQSTEYQREMAERLHLPFEVLSDESLALTSALRLPSFEFGGATLLKRHTLVIERGRVVRCHYPVFPPDADAARVVAWLRERKSKGEAR